LLRLFRTICKPAFMKQLFLSILLISSGLFLRAQQTVNDPLAEKRAVGSFHGIEVGTGIELLLSQGNSEEVAVSASTVDFRDKIVTKVEKGVLKIQYESKTGAVNRKNETKGLKAYVSCKTLDQLYATTGAHIKISGVLQSPSLDMKANTGAEISGKVVLGSLQLDQNTGSKVTLTGTTEKMELEGSTGSKFTGDDMTANTCKIEVSTGARLLVHVAKELQVKASTGGTVKYKGEAGIKSIKTNTGGAVSRI
jgi:Putative auto-transporter adhesin, head GIN domain